MAALFAALGLLLTLLALALLGAGGYLAATLLLPGPRRTEPLELAVTTLLLAIVEGVAVALALGALGLLRLDLALALQTLLVYGLYRKLLGRGWRSDDLADPLRSALRRAWARLVDYPVLALVTLHAAGVELLRGLLRPPLSWDSLMYHLFLTATWLQQGSFDIVAARHPTTFYQFMPGGGSLWTWWWMAPSHSELWVSLAYVPHWVLLGLAAGGVARELGARRHWPVAGFLTLLTPTVVRFLPTQYVDIGTGAALAAGTFFAIRWWRSAATRDAMLMGLAVGLAAGTKILGLPFGAALGGLAALLARGGWRRRWVQLLVAGAAAALIGGYFYARNLSYGDGPFGYTCAKQATTEETVPGGFPSPDSALALLPELLANRALAGAFLGATHPVMTELGIGPPVALLAVAILALPFVFRGPARRVAWLVCGQIAIQAVVWMTIPYAASGHIFANVRYLTGGLALAFAGAVALGERWLPERWLRLLAIAVAVQDLLMLNPRMPLGVRWTLLIGLVVVLALGLSARIRQVALRRWRPLAGLATILLLVLVPAFARFRVRDRERAFAQDYVAHLSTTRLFAAGWGWLDKHAGTGTVAVSHAPENFFVYPAMGPFLERRAVYVHVNQANHTNPLLYPGCQTRVDASAGAWLRNLRAEGVRWLHLGRYPEFEFPLEDRWARERPDVFVLRFDHTTNRIYEVRQGAAPP